MTNFSSPIEITLTRIVGEEITYYTLDGTDPYPTNPSVSLYILPFEITVSCTLKARNYSNDLTTYSQTLTEEFVYIQPQCDDVVFFTPSTTFDNPIALLLSTTTIGADIYYYINNETSYSLYVGVINITKDTLIRAFARKTDYLDSNITSGLYKKFVPIKKRKIDLYNKNGLTIQNLVSTNTSYQKIPYKFNRQITKTIAGKSKELYIDVFHKFTINYPYLTESQYENLITNWKVDYPTYVYTEEDQEYRVKILNEEISFQFYYNKEKDENYYTGSIELDEVY